MIHRLGNGKAIYVRANGSLRTLGYAGTVTMSPNPYVKAALPISIEATETRAYFVYPPKYTDLHTCNPVNRFYYWSFIQRDWFESNEEQFLQEFSEKLHKESL